MKKIMILLMMLQISTICWGQNYSTHYRQIGLERSIKNTLKGLPKLFKILGIDKINFSPKSNDKLVADEKLRQLTISVLRTYKQGRENFGASLCAQQDIRCLDFGKNEVCFEILCDTLRTFFNDTLWVNNYYIARGKNKINLGFFSQHDTLFFTYEFDWDEKKWQAGQREKYQLAKWVLTRSEYLLEKRFNKFPH